MAFSVVADIDEKRMEKDILKLAEKYFKDSVQLPCLSDCHEAKACLNYATPSPEPFDKTLSKRNHQANCIIGALAPSLYQERERLATVLLCNILGGPATNSILNSVLREKNGWVYGVECGYVQFSDTGLVTISLGCDKNNLDKCLAAIDKEIAKLQNECMSERKLKAAKKQLLGQLAISSDNGETQCLSMGKGLLAYGKVSTGKENRAMVEAITAEDIREMAQKIFDTTKLSKLIYI
jgi:predicted Zn-dependent peptidase